MSHATTQRPAIFSPWRLPGWSRLRLLVAALALAVGLASFMHVAHSHHADGTVVSPLCSFCASFDRGTAPPPAAATQPEIAGRVTPEPVATTALALSPVRAAYRPRAPPHSAG